jgi:hypothetical protein
MIMQRTFNHLAGLHPSSAAIVVADFRRPEHVEGNRSGTTLKIASSKDCRKKERKERKELIPKAVAKWLGRDNVT